MVKYVFIAEGKRLFVSFCLLLSCSIGAAQSDVEAISRVYSREADTIIEVSPQQAYSLAQIAVEYDDTNSDAYHIKGRIDAREQKTRWQAIDFLDMAVSHGSFRDTSRREAHLLLAELLTDSGFPDRALEILEPLFTADSLDADVLALRIRALRLAEERETAEELARRADEVYSDDPRFLVELVRLVDAPGEAYLPRLERYRYPQEDPWFSAILHIAATTGDADIRARAVELYLDNQGADPAIFLYAGELEEQERIRRFLAQGGDEDLRLLQSMHGRVSAEGRELLEERFRDFTGELAIDYRRRGLEEERFEFRNGTLVQWRIDSRVDGRAEWILRFDEEENAPDEVVRRLPDRRRIELFYTRYPEASCARIGGERLHFRPGSFTYRLFDHDVQLRDGGLGVFSEYEITPPEDERLSRDTMISHVYLVQELEAEEVVRATRFREGVRVLESSDTLGDGRVDTVSYFHGGSIQRRLRDPRGTGFFEIYQEYANGVLSWTGYDTNRDGNYDFIESYEDGRLAEWDYSADGFVDVRHYEFVDETTRTQFMRFLDPPVELRIDRVWRHPLPVQ